jgi:hypothetical protein
LEEQLYFKKKRLKDKDIDLDLKIETVIMERSSLLLIARVRM